MRLLRRMANIFSRSRRDQDLQDEFAAHLAFLEESEQASGRSPDEARRAARLRFGNPVSHRENAVDAVTSTSIERMGKESAFALRRLVRAPVFTTTAVVTLALAIAANIAIFAVVYRVILNPLPYDDAGRLIALDHGAHALNFPAGIGMSRGLHYQYALRARTIEAVAVYVSEDLTLIDDGAPERLHVVRATPTLGAVLRRAPALGRWFTDAEAVPGAARVAVISHGLWTRRFGADARVLGRVVSLGGSPTSIVGVMPADFTFPDARVDAWQPEQMTQAMGFGIFAYVGVARLRAGVSLADVRAELNALIADLPHAFPGDPFAEGNGPGITLFSAAVPLKDVVVGNAGRGLWILLASVLFVLSIASANVANLFLVRCEARQREIAVRRALGAGRTDIARYFFSETAILAAAAAIFGVAGAGVAVRLLVADGPANLPRMQEIRLDSVSIAYGVVLAVLAAVGLAAIPLWRRGSPTALQEIGRGNTPSAERQRLRKLLIAGQVAIALVLLVASGLLVRSFQRLRAADLGFGGTSTLTLSIGLPETTYPTRAAAVSTHQAIVDRLSSLPGIASTAATTCLPLAGGCGFGNTVLVKDHPSPAGTPLPVAVFRAVSGGYFEAIAMRLVQGRALTRSDVDRREPVVVVNQAFASRLFGNSSAIDRYIASNRPLAKSGPNASPTWLQIVGIVADTPIVAINEPPFPQLFMPMSIAGGPDFPLPSLVGPSVSVMTFVIRPRPGLTIDLTTVRDAVASVDSTLAVAQVETMQAIVDRASATAAFTMVLIAIAGIAAVTLGVIGIYGVMSYAVSLRTSEIGVRLALGAAPSLIRAMIVKQGLSIVVAGIGTGTAMALLSGRALTPLLYRVSARDPAVFAETIGLVLGVSLLACWLPARRAARISPLDALRAD